MNWEQEIEESNRTAAAKKVLSPISESTVIARDLENP